MGEKIRQSLAPRVLLMNAVKVEERPKPFVLFARMWEKGSAYRQSLTPRVLLMNAVKVEESVYCLSPYNADIHQ